MLWSWVAAALVARPPGESASRIWAGTGESWSLSWLGERTSYRILAAVGQRNLRQGNSCAVTVFCHRILSPHFLNQTPPVILMNHMPTIRIIMPIRKILEAIGTLRSESTEKLLIIAPNKVMPTAQPLTMRKNLVMMSNFFAIDLETCVMSTQSVKKLVCPKLAYHLRHTHPHRTEVQKLHSRYYLEE